MLENENKHLFETMGLFVVFGMILGWLAYKQNPYNYVCIDENVKYDISYEHCMEDCNIGKYECLRSCGCGRIETRKDNPIVQVLIGGLGGAALCSLYFVIFKGY